MLARASGREREIAVRSALGATGSRLVRQLLAESVVLGAAAGGVGLVAAAASLQALVSLLPADTPRLSEVSLHWPVFLFAAIASVATGILFGLIPALRMASPNLRDSLHAGSRSVAGKAGQFRVSMLLVMGQIALSVVVITAAGLMLHSLWSLLQVNPGFRTDRIVTAEVSMDADACRAMPATAGGAAVPSGRCAAFYRHSSGSVAQSGRDGRCGAGRCAAFDCAKKGIMCTTRRDIHARRAKERCWRRDALLRQSTLRPAGREPDAGTAAGCAGYGRGEPGGSDQPEDGGETVANENPLGRHLLSVEDEPAPAVWEDKGAVNVVGIVEQHPRREPFGRSWRRCLSSADAGARTAGDVCAAADEGDDRNGGGAAAGGGGGDQS